MIRTISAIQLQNEYETNEINADDKYTDKTLIVTGIVKSVAKTNNGSETYLIISDDYHPYSQVQCFLSQKGIKQAASLDINREVSVKGYCQGKKIVTIDGKDQRLNYPVLAHCIIVE